MGDCNNGRVQLIKIYACKVHLIVYYKYMDQASVWLSPYSQVCLNFNVSAVFVESVFDEVPLLYTSLTVSVDVVVGVLVYSDYNFGIYIIEGEQIFSSTSALTRNGVVNLSGVCQDGEIESAISCASE